MPARKVSIHIGVNAVDPAAYPVQPVRLQAAESDAAAMLKLAVGAGLSATSLVGAAATRQAVIEAFECAAEQLDAGDLLVVTFSGHGATFEDAPEGTSVPRPLGAVNRIPGDEPRDQSWCLRDGVLIDDDLYLLLCKFRRGVRIYVLSDSCYSGTILRLEAADAANEPTRRDAEFAAAPAAPADPAEVKASVLLSAGARDTEFTYTTVRRGAFTGAVLAAWDHGRFTGDVRQFHAAIQERSDPGQVPALVRYGRTDESFETSRPFGAGPVPLGDLPRIDGPDAGTADVASAAPVPGTPPAASDPSDPVVSVEPGRGLVPPMVVHLCWHQRPTTSPDCATIARELYEFLHRPLADDPVQRPGLEIPVQYGRNLGGLLDALVAGTEPPADARVVVMILDAAAYNAPIIRRFIERAMARWSDPEGTATARGEVFLPIVLDRRWHANLSGAAVTTLAGITVGVGEADPATRCWRLGSDVAVVVGRALLRRHAGGAAAKPKVFLSHTKADGATLARQLAAHFKNQTRIEAWFDVTDVERGAELTSQLEAAAGQGVLVVIRTDHYSESPWCGLELLAAKRIRIPIVTVLATADGEPTTSAYSGNHRTLTWSEGREWDVVARCVQEWLRAHHFVAHATGALASAGLPADARTIPRRPELFDLTTTPGAPGRNLIVYPDPPLAEDETAVLRAAQPSLRLVTPNTMLGRVLLANDPRPPLAGHELAFSLSAAEDLPELTGTPDGSGLTQQHLDDVVYTIVLTTLHSGARIAYGGDFRKARGYAAQLSDLHRARRRLGIGLCSQLVCFVDEEGERTGDALVEYEPATIAGLPGAASYPPAIRDTLWRMAMRHAMAARCTGRIMAGGQARAATVDQGPGYLGPWPGLLEEAVTTLRAGKGLYLLGAFGGFTGALTRMLIRRQVPSEFTTPTDSGSRLALVASALDLARARLVTADNRAMLLGNDDATFAGVAQLAQDVLDRWRRFHDGDGTAWRNGLDVGENLRLFRATDRTEIAHLVFQGLRRIARDSNAGSATVGAPALDLALYHGDIASVPGVDGYAVTTTPGVPNVGAMAALDAAMSGRLARDAASTPPRAHITSVPVQTDILAGHHAFVVRVDLPAAGGVPAAHMVALSAELAREADRLGISTIAAAPIATTMGLTAAASVQAMIAGVRAGRGASGYPASLVVCEVDRARYEAIRKDLEAAGVTVRELRAGPVPASRADAVVVHANVALDDIGDAHLSLTVYAPDADAAVVPHDVVSVPAATWRALRTRPATFAASIATGQDLWQLLRPRMRQLLERHADRRLLLVANALASGLPWELLATDTEATAATRGGLIRRAALSGDFRPPAERATTDATLRVLLIVDPTGNLPGAAAEGLAVEQSLKGRPDVAVTVLRGGDATLDRVTHELRDGFHDVLHYAGHAYFDAATPARSGLILANRARLTGPDLAAITDGARATLPRLIVLGACESSRLRGGGDGDDDSPASPATATPGVGAASASPASAAPSERIDDLPLAEVLLRAGVATLVGTFFPVGDNAARSFASSFHAHLAQGKSVGDAVRAGRAALHTARHPDWGNFLLYGDDTLTL